MDNPVRKVGKPRRQPLALLFAAHRGECRVIYQITDQRLVIEAVSVAHRRDAYRSWGSLVPEDLQILRCLLSGYGRSGGLRN